MPLKRRLHIDSVNVQEAGCMLVQHRAFYQVLFTAALKEDRKHAAGATCGRLRLARLVNLQPTRGGNRSRIHQVRLLLEDLVQHALDGSVAYEFRLPLRDVTAVAD